MENQLRVLCVDNDDTCELLSTILGFSKIKVISAFTVADAWRLAQAEPFDLYLLETRLSDGDGFELCRRLHQFAPRTPIVFYSAEAYEVDRQKGLTAGATAYLVKPYFDDLTSTILEIITDRDRSTSASLPVFDDVMISRKNTFKQKLAGLADCAATTD